ncbi:two-component system, OmpR family, sensor histidine kinase PhoQ [Solimonas aquatica]|uniref:histidine kinase n=1 Tax=Solimonas aquatica TaxID=489703 RepID=A0A1H8ZK91_9GAMM|nr:ATP-binding protein [Solimonas aquatica]SEP64774.1 two-component system, OmpR family, sensor histidine kinase PhoQ [Solimonas aquatica]
MGFAARLIAALPRVQLRSFRSRLLAATATLLLGFVVLGGVALEKAFESALLQSQQDKLEGLIYALLAAASTNRQGELTITLDAVPDRRLREPLSGLQAALFDERGVMVWASTQELQATPPSKPAVGEWRFEHLRKPDAFRLSFGLRWIDSDGNEPRLFTVSVIDNTASYERQAQVYRRTLWGWLGATAASLSIGLLVILRWGLLPLRRIGDELHRIEKGEQGEILGEYPDELKPLTRDLNAMIVSERSQQTRYRNALGDLAHSLKTPLAVLRGLGSDQEIPDPQRLQLDEQLSRMHHIVDHQLRRAAAVGSRTLTEPVALKPLSDKIMQALAKVYSERAIRFENELDVNLRQRADQGDLYEMLGNLLENAAKYGQQRVRLSAQNEARLTLLHIDDDGPGWPDEPQKLLQRGVRADTRKPGQGIGLAAVHEIVQAYGGELRFGHSPLGGARISLVLPSR